MLRQFLIRIAIASLLTTAVTESRAETPATRPADSGRRENAVELLTKAETFPPDVLSANSVRDKLFNAHLNLGQLDAA